MLLTAGTYLKCGSELHPTRTKTITYSFDRKTHGNITNMLSEWKLNNPSYKELKSARMVSFRRNRCPKSQEFLSIY
jgi:hypothetical protein